MVMAMSAMVGQATAVWIVTFTPMASSSMPMQTRIQRVVFTLACGLARRMAMSVRHAAQNCNSTPREFTATTERKRSDQAITSAKVRMAEASQSAVVKRSMRTGTPCSSAHRLAMAMVPNHIHPLNWKCRKYWMVQ